MIGKNKGSRERVIILVSVFVGGYGYDKILFNFLIENIFAGLFFEFYYAYQLIQTKLCNPVLKFKFYLNLHSFVLIG